MSWCDKLFSVPSAGLGLETHFASGDSLFDSIAPIIDKYAKDHPNKLRVEKHETLAFEFSLEDGFKYGLESTRLFVDFQHRMRFRAVSGGHPVGELVSVAEPFTTLLPQVVNRLVEAAQLLPNNKTRHFSRFGIVSATDVDEVDLPPGLTRLIQYVGRPWKNRLGGFALTITGVVDETDRYVDRCIHQITKKEDGDALMAIRLDWQRQFTKPILIERTNLEREASLAQKASLLYFEDVGEGNRFDEQILGSPALD